MTTTTTLRFDRRELFDRLVDPEGRLLPLLQERLGLDARPEADAKGGRLLLSGQEHEVEAGARLVRELYFQLRKGRILHAPDVVMALDGLRKGHVRDVDRLFDDAMGIRLPKRTLMPKGRNQRTYIELMRSRDVVFSIGPAGTGKTYLAMAVALASLQANACRRIVLTRPAVEAGERLGFLPGDLVEKVNPYLRPLHDALYDLLDLRRATQLVKEGVIEVAPLAFMRGRTLNDAFVILDEAQNTTIEQMKMFLTRIGQQSRAVITGDVTQIDLPEDVPSGLVHAARILDDVPGIGFARLEKQDIVRHPLVAEIVHAYEREAEQGAPARERRGDRARREGGKP